jgi:hypothetical protein
LSYDDIDAFPFDQLSFLQVRRGHHGADASISECSETS